MKKIYATYAGGRQEKYLSIQDVINTLGISRRTVERRLKDAYPAKTYDGHIVYLSEEPNGRS